MVWLQFDQRAGHQQGGHRPAVVLSPANYNGRTGLMLCCPVTTQVKGYPFEVAIAGTPPSVALADQVRCEDWRARNALEKGRVTSGELAELRAKVRALIG